MSDWDSIKNEILGKNLESISWTSDRAGLILLIEAAENHGIKAPALEDFYISRFREIVKDAKAAIAHGNLDQLHTYIDMAATLPVAELRIKLGKKDRTKIVVLEEKAKEQNQYTITLTADQFDRIQKSTSAFFDFQTTK